MGVKFTNRCHPPRIPTEKELPSTNQLIKSTILAAATAGVLLITVVMPAEYGIDPTGIGNIIGLKKMGEIRVSLEKEAAADLAKDTSAKTELQQKEVNPVVPATPQASATSVKTLNHEMQVTLAPDEGAEIKVEMSKGNKVQYAWSTDGGKANFDVHADSQTLGIDYHQYSKGSSQSEQGSIEAAFDGSHGWFWRNRTSDPVVITLKTEGEYTEISRK
jgi:hypothetical protein